MHEVKTPWVFNGPKFNDEKVIDKTKPGSFYDLLSIICSDHYEDNRAFTNNDFKYFENDMYVFGNCNRIETAFLVKHITLTLKVGDEWHNIVWGLQDDGKLGVSLIKTKNMGFFGNADDSTTVADITDEVPADTWAAFVEEAMKK